MGFWHTGYIEFHEPVGLGTRGFEPSPPKFSCPICGEAYLAPDDLIKHRFESHPLYRPMLFIQGQELGTSRFRVARRLGQADVKLEDCDGAFLNGTRIPVSSVPRVLTQISSGVCQLELGKNDVCTKFELDFCIASEEDLQGIETEFQRLAVARKLDLRSIDEFISASSNFVTAIGYLDGICDYLYGVLAKERSNDSSLSHEKYVNKFNKAVEQLAAYDRPLARIIRSLVEFHFNHFEEAAHLASNERIGRAAASYATWKRGRKITSKQKYFPSVALNNLETSVTDWDTEQIVRWAVRPLEDLTAEIDEMESSLNRGLVEYDSVKVRVLLGETYTVSGDYGRALKHAKELCNLPGLKRWANSVIYAHSDDHNDHH